jgi:hypothetical protein
VGSRKGPGRLIFLPRPSHRSTRTSQGSTSGPFSSGSRTTTPASARTIFGGWRGYSAVTTRKQQAHGRRSSVCRSLVSLPGGGENGKILVTPLKARRTPISRRRGMAQHIHPSRRNNRGLQRNRKSRSVSHGNPRRSLAADLPWTFPPPSLPAPSRLGSFHTSSEFTASHLTGKMGSPSRWASSGLRTGPSSSWSSCRFSSHSRETWWFSGRMKRA